MRRWSKSVKDGAKLFGQCMVKFVKDQEALLISAGITSGMVLLCRVMNVPINIDTRGGIGIDSGSKIIDMETYPRNSIETAVKAVIDDALTMTFGSDKIAAAKRVARIVKNANADENTKAYAVKMLSKLCRTMTFGGDKNQINNIIEEIMKEN